MLAAAVLVAWTEVGRAQATDVRRRPFPRMEAGRQAMRALGPVEIAAGFVLSDGDYIPLPYVVKAKGGRVHVNGVEVALPRLGEKGRFALPRHRWLRQAQSQNVMQVEQHLRCDGLLICTKGRQTIFLPAERAIGLFDVLLDSDSADAKLRNLMMAEPSLMPARQWQLVIESFEAPPELVDRIIELKDCYAAPYLDRVDSGWQARVPFAGITVLGFALAVWALGTLLGCRPPALTGTPETGSLGMPSRQVVRLVILIVVLGIYDLVCTLFAHQLGGLWELNPFAHSLMARTSLVTACKLAATVGAGILLVIARRCKIAQIGSWWIGVLYTVLILRWATYNSVFMA